MDYKTKTALKIGGAIGLVAFGAGLTYAGSTPTYTDNLTYAIFETTLNALMVSGGALIALSSTKPDKKDE